MGAMCIMKIPPLYSTIRVNTLKMDMAKARDRMQNILDQTYVDRQHIVPVVEIHGTLKDLLVIRGSGPFELEERPSLEIYVDMKCGKSVLRGADVFSSGLLGSSRSFVCGENVSIFMDTDGACRHGWKKPFLGNKVFLGIGRSTVSRDQLFKSKMTLERGTVGVRVTSCVWNQPTLACPIEDWGFPQNLPSVLCAHVLGPQPGETVLDMCAAPGGKSTHIASLMGDQGRVVCVDHSALRIALVRRNADIFSLSSIDTLRMDATKLTAHRPSSFPAEGFDRVLLDAPCSGLGQRPLFFGSIEKKISSFPPLQKKLFRSAVELVKVGGYMVYSTCTLNIEENESIVAWALSQYPNIRLVAQEPLIGNQEAMVCADLNKQIAMVQKFDPTKFCPVHSQCKSNCLHNIREAETITHWSRPTTLDVNCDTIGFFIAKFQKVC